MFLLVRFELIPFVYSNKSCLLISNNSISYFVIPIFLKIKSISDSKILLLSLYGIFTFSPISEKIKNIFKSNQK